MSTATSHLEHPVRPAFAVSMAIHALLFLLFWLFGGKMFLEPMRVTLLIETTAAEEPQDTPSEIQPTRKLRKKALRSAKHSAAPSREGANNNPWSDYERELFSRKGKQTVQQGSPGKANTNAWGDEKFARNDKQGTDEKVTIPKGNTSAATRWRKGAARKLVSLPAIEYPESVRKKSGQGQVELMIEVGPDGRVEEVEIVKSSGYTRLDLNARNAYRNAVFSASPSGDRATGIIIVKFKMRDS